MAPCRNAIAPSIAEHTTDPCRVGCTPRIEDSFYISWFPTLQETFRTSPQDAIRVGVAGER